jgi:hypothetical protein
MRGERMEHDDLLTRVKTELDASADALSPEIMERLRSARLNAVEAFEKKEERFFLFPAWLTAGGVATVAVVMLAVTFWLPGINGNQPGLPDDEIDEVIATTESPEFFEDLDFYLWLAEQKNAR